MALLTQEKDNQPQSKDERKSDRNNNERESQNVQEKVKNVRKTRGYNIPSKGSDKSKKKLWNKGNIHGNKSTEKEHKQ